MQTLFQDIRYGARTLLKSRGFTAMAVVSLALGIGANAAIFSLLDAVLLKRLPVRHPDQLVFLEQSNASQFKRSSGISYVAFEQLRRQNTVVSDACFFSYATRINANVNGEVEVVEGQPVSGNFFSLLGLDPVAGRAFTEGDDKESSDQAVAVVSYSYWQRRFNSSRSVVGQSVNLNNTPFTIIGIAPPEFFGVIVGSAPDIFLPSVMAEKILPHRFGFRDGSLPFVLARLQPGVVVSQAIAPLTLTLQQANLAQAGTELTPAKQQAIQKLSVKLLPASQGFNALRQQFSEPLRLLMAVVGLVLLIACANVANLILARGATRRREIALRLALGAGRFRLARQLFTESLMLALVGGGLGLLLASWCSSLLLRIVTSGRNPFSAQSRLAISVPLDGRIILFTSIVSLLAAILFGLAPAWRATDPQLATMLKDNSRGLGARGRFRWDEMLVVAQVALSLTLLVGAGLFIRSLSKLKSVDVGFKRDNVLLFSVDPQLLKYQPSQVCTLYKGILGGLGNIPGVASVSLTRQGLLSGSGTQGSIKVPGRVQPLGENSYSSNGDDTEWNAPYLYQVGPKFFETLGMTMVRGRDFGGQDNETSPKVAVVNEAFARYYFGDENPVGQQFDRGEGDGGLVEIVGVVKDAKGDDIREQTRRAFYVPYLQDQSSWRETTFQVRTTVDPLSVVPAIRREVRQSDPNLPIFRVQTLDNQIDESLGQDRLLTSLASLFGALALLLACTGLYGVLSYSVSRRTQEIGIRMALGAQRKTVLQMVLRQGMAMTVIGVALGLGAAYLLTRYLESLSTMLYGVRPRDPLTYVVMAAVLLVVATCACLSPARRATKVDPLVALRYE